MRWLSISLPRPDCCNTGEERPTRWLIVTGRPGTPDPATIDDIAGRLVGYDRVVAVNGGFALARCLDLQPDMVVGDLDSMAAGERRDMIDSGCRVQTHPVRKDMTDTHLAFDLAATAGCHSVTVVMTASGRFDHVVANLMVAVAGARQGIAVSIVDVGLEAAVVSGPAKLYVEESDLTVSLIPCSTVAGVTLNGLDYPLSGDTLEPGSTLGVSNRTTAIPATIQFDQGVLLVTVTDRE